MCWAQKVVLVNLIANGLEDYAKDKANLSRPRTFSRKAKAKKFGLKAKAKD